MEEIKKELNKFIRDWGPPFSKRYKLNFNRDFLALLKLAQGKAYYDGYMLGLNNNHPRKSKIEYDFEDYWNNFEKEIQP